MDTEGNGMTWKLYEADCFDVFPSIEDKSIDMILCDLPYGTTACKWDTPLPLDDLWHEYKRIIKSNGAIVLTASQPFTTTLIHSNIEMFRYELIWDKLVLSNPYLANKMPLKCHENILIFYEKVPTYNPQMVKTDKISSENKGKYAKSELFGTEFDKTKYVNNGLRFPNSVLKINSQSNECNNLNRVHPSQKPVALFEYLIKTYTNENDLVLDNCAGSGTTGVACQNLNRNCILIEKEPDYCQIIRERMRTVEDLIVEERKQQTLTDFIPAK